MTTIVTDGRCMAGDGRFTTNGTIVSDEGVKVFRLDDGRVAGFSGNAGRMKRLVKWLNEGGDYPKIDDDSAAILILSNEGIEYVDSNGDFTSLPAPASIGSGSDHARAAMLAGTAPEQAVAISARLDVYSGGRITVLNLKE